MDECVRGTLRSSKSEGGCFGGLRRRNEGYNGRKPVEASLGSVKRRKKDGPMKLRRSVMLWLLGITSLFVIAAAISYSIPALADPSVTVYRSPT